jgi:hypothetical protein
MAGVGRHVRGLPDWNLEDVAAAPRDAMDDLETFEWRGLDLLGGGSRGA